MSRARANGSVDAFSRMMQPQKSVDSDISLIAITSDNGSGSLPIDMNACPDFSTHYVVIPNHLSLASQKNPSVEMHFVISKRISLNGKSNGCSATCAFCGALFASTNMTKMRMHLTGETSQSTRVAACPKIPGACRQFYLDKTASEKAVKEKTHAI